MNKTIMTMMAALMAATVAYAGDDSAELERRIFASERGVDGVRRVSIGAKPDGSPWTLTRPLVLPSDFTLTLDGACLVLASNAFCNALRSDGATNVTVVGRNGATVDGGEYNGLSERNAGKDGRPPVWVNNLLLFTNVKGFRVEGIRFVRQGWWALDFIGCSQGVIRQIDFLSHHVTVLKDGTRLDTVGVDYQGVLVKNSDGIDIRAGCHDILIEGITGFCQDDTVALTCLRGRIEAAHLSPTAEYAIRNVRIRDVRTSSMCSNVRLLAQDGCTLENVTVEDVVDTGDGKTYVSGHADFGVRLGDRHLYGKAGACVSDIVIRNVKSSAESAAVGLFGKADRVTVENVTPLPGCPRAVLDAR